MKRRNLLIGSAVFLLAVIGLLSIPNVAQAVKRWFGYVPGSGVVDQGVPLRVLEQEVDTTAGISQISLLQAVADSDHLRLYFQVENLPNSEKTGEQPQDYCHGLAWLQTDDGQKWDAQTISANFWGSGYSRQLEFSAFPADVNSATLVLPCLEGVLTADSPSGIQIPFTLVAAPEGMQVFPIVELPTPTAAPVTTQSATPAEQISLELTKYIQTDTQLFLLGTLKSSNPEFWLDLVDSADVRLLDSSGVAVSLKEDHTVSDPDLGERSNQFYPFAYEVTGAYQPGEASLILDQAWIMRQSDAGFDFDPGENPQPGQIWNLNQSLQLGSHQVVVKEATLNKDGKGFTFSLQTDDEITNLVLTDLDHPVLGGGGGSENSGFTYRDGLPAGVIHITVSNYSERIKGPWQAKVELPENQNPAASTPLPEACLTQSTWQQALLSSTRDFSFPEDSLMLLANPAPPDYLYRLFLAQPEASTMTALLLSNGGSLSPDRKSLVAGTDDGMVLYDLATGTKKSIAGTSRRDRDPLWSPQGSAIAFTRGPATGLIGAQGPHEVWVMDADGSNQRALVADGEANFAQSWLPDGKTLIYTTTTAEGALLNSLEIETGEVTQLNSVNYQNTNVSVSPDGKRMAYVSMLPGEKYGVWVSDLDGSNAKLVANADPIVVTEPKWSPDGYWLAMSVHDLTLDENGATLAAVNPDSCKIVPLISLKGYVNSWR